MNRKNLPAAPKRPAVLIEALEPRIAPAGLLNESKFTSVAVGGTLLLDASGKPGTFQGLTTGSGGGSGSYLLYITAGRALVFTTDLNGNGRLDPGEITGISLGKDSLNHDPALLLFSDVNGDIVTNLDGTSGSTLTDSDHKPNNGRDGQILTDTNIASITLRTLVDSDIDPAIPGNTVANRLALTSFSIHGNIDLGGNLGALTIDTSGLGALTSKFDGSNGDQLLKGVTPSIGGIFTGTAANNQPFHFTQNNPFSPQVEGVIQVFRVPSGEHGGDISSVKAASSGTTFSIGTLATGDGGTGARGGNLTDITMHGDLGGYQLIAGNGGDGGTGGQGGSILNYNDLGTNTSEAILHTGNGGVGLLAKGGDGGLATFATTNIAAGVQVIMGAGGNGFGSGGNGASFASATFNTPETGITVGGQFQGTWHNIGDIGYQHPLTNADGTISYAPEVIDFNGDGFGDGVYTTSKPDQVIVVFGDGSGGLLDNNGDFSGPATATVALKVPGVVNPVVTVGDFNGDGRPDIAVASQDPNSFGGIYVFLNQINTALDPINSHNYTRSLVGDHPFSSPLQTALPSLTTPLPNSGATFYQTSGAVYALAAGDFNGDGVTDIAYVHNVTAENPNQTQAQTVGILLGDSKTGLVNGVTRAIGTGYFYANTAAPKAAPILLNSVVGLGGFDSFQASSLAIGNLPDATTGVPAQGEALFFGTQDARGFVQYTLPVNAGTHTPTGLMATGIGYGGVDTNRNVGPTQIAFTGDVTLETLAIQDFNNDGNADVVVLTKSPANFLITLAGSGTGTFNVTSSPTGNDNAGIFLGGNLTAVTFASVDANKVLATDTSPASTSGVFNDVAVLIFPNNGRAFIQEYALAGGNMVTPLLNYTIPITQKDIGVQALEPYYALAPNFNVAATDPATLHPLQGYGLLTPNTTNNLSSDLVIYSVFQTIDFGTGLPLFTYSELIRFETANGYAIRSGDGGDSTTGNGGNAGLVGGTLTAGGNNNITGAIAITFPVSTSYNGEAFLAGGDGGNGGAAGGIGGDISGITVRYASGTTTQTSTADLAAGNGGNGRSGDGGRGGNLSLLSIIRGENFFAGNAGSGLHGGTGGSITGNQEGVFDTDTIQVNLVTGIGGEGAIGGGNGGSITKWDSEFGLLLISTTGNLTYTTGAGGGAAGGIGGNGGAIVDSSPDQNVNNLSGALTLTTGTGGDGLSGGNGGAITTFVNSGTIQSAVPTALSVLTGRGGIGVSGTGGTGGAITGFSSNATGLTNFDGGDLTGFARVIAGDGGTSYGAAGGIGGSISNSIATATSTPMIVAGGAGGDGLTIGGSGGSVTNSQLNSAALQIGKLLIVGGKGGDALSARPQDITLASDVPGTDYSIDLAHAVLAFGNVRGTGGNGGNIANITQPVGAQTAVDLIAGNGGSTVNAGTVTTASTGVGIGGSVTGVTLTGTVGAISRDVSLGALTNPPIKSYSFDDGSGIANTSISALVDFLAQPGNADFSLTDGVGNVGILAGRAGLVRGAQPASDGVNGDVTNITATSIMSIVAGSVDSVAPVRILSGITVTNSDGVLGADKSLAGDARANSQYGPNGVLDYFNPVTNQVVTTLAAGDKLIDGALFASKIDSSVGAPIRGPRVFPVATT